MEMTVGNNEDKPKPQLEVPPVSGQPPPMEESVKTESVVNNGCQGINNFGVIQINQGCSPHPLRFLLKFFVHKLYAKLVIKVKI